MKPKISTSKVTIVAISLLFIGVFLGLPSLFGAVAHAQPWQPAPGTTWQWQLSGTIDESFDVEMYDIDLFETPSATIARLQGAGRIVICYFSAGSWERGRPDSGDFPKRIRGKRLDGFPDERWLDVRQIDELAPIMEARLDLAVQKGCDGVEPDNVDGYQNKTGFPISGRAQRKYNKWLAREAHARGLSVGLKNALGQIKKLVKHFDWALNEQCFEFDECRKLLPFIRAGKAVFGVEYEGKKRKFCPRANKWGFSWLKKRLRLGAWRQSCL